MMKWVTKNGGCVGLTNQNCGFEQFKPWAWDDWTAVASVGEGFTFLIKSGCKQGNRERQWHKMYLLHTEKTSDRQFHVSSFADTYDPAYLIQDIKGWSVCVCATCIIYIYGHMQHGLYKQPTLRFRGPAEALLEPPHSSIFMIRVLNWVRPYSSTTNFAFARCFRVFGLVLASCLGHLFKWCLMKLKISPTKEEHHHPQYMEVLLTNISQKVGGIRSVLSLTKFQFFIWHHFVLRTKSYCICLL